MARPSKYDPLRSKPPMALAFVATFASAAALTVLYNHANSPQLTFAQIEQEATQELSRIGYTWARVSISDGIATIEGEAPGESERVIAYDIVRRTLRPLMGRSPVIAAVSSHLKLSPQAVASLAQANSERDGGGSDYYLSADANMPYPAPPIITGATERADNTDAAVTTAALEPTTAADQPPAPSNKTATNPEMAQVASETSATSTDPNSDSVAETPEPEAEPARTVTIEPPAAPEAIADASPAATATQSPNEELKTEPDHAEQEIAISATPVPGPAPASDSVPTTMVASTPAAVEEEERAHLPVEAANIKPASEHAEPARIETAALDTPAQIVATATAATEAKSTLDPIADCKAEFSEALSQAMIQFGSNSAAIDRQSHPLLDKLAQIAKHCSRFSLVVEGHTDLSGSRSHNQVLSQKRADAVRWALVDRGVDMDHISARGFGSSQPLVSGTSDAANARNRRIEFSVLEPKVRSRNASTSAPANERRIK
ncbi:MAG: OmpA family protein [Hyphomicrobiaceae bacterium]